MKRRPPISLLLNCTVYPQGGLNANSFCGHPRKPTARDSGLWRRFRDIYEHWPVGCLRSESHCLQKALRLISDKNDLKQSEHSVVLFMPHQENQSGKFWLCQASVKGSSSPLLFCKNCSTKQMSFGMPGWNPAPESASEVLKLGCIRMTWGAQIICRFLLHLLEIQIL